MEFPRYIYKDGKLNANGKRLVNDSKEALLAVEAGYWAHNMTKEAFIAYFQPAIKQAQIEKKESDVFDRFSTPVEEKLSPQQKATITRNKNKEAQDVRK